MNLFERAARAKTRIVTFKGPIAAEDLFDLDLTATGNRLSLDRVARDVYAELKQYDEVSFVETRPEPRKIELQLQLDLVKHVIEAKKAEASAAETRAKKMELRRQLTEALADKQAEGVKAMTVEEIQAKLNELGD